ncbi:hypothetical protein GCM10022215_39870 [Nocardioides fonticola]|uniref:Uncharacterized protein n=1 Tax=Nocardioides fonticola TaxID=450363 RepID=A0ABP7XZP1_9ACTN
MDSRYWTDGVAGVVDAGETVRRPDAVRLPARRVGRCPCHGVTDTTRMWLGSHSAHLLTPGDHDPDGDPRPDAGDVPDPRRYDG